MESDSVDIVFHGKGENLGASMEDHGLALAERPFTSKEETAIDEGAIQRQPVWHLHALAHDH